MNILTDVLSLIRRQQFATKAELNDVLVLGKWDEQPDMTGVASPIPYKSVKVIRVKDLVVSSESCDNVNIDKVVSAVGVFKEQDIDPGTGKCTNYFRSLYSLSPNLTITLSSDGDYLEFDSEGEPNLAANVGGGAGIWKDKVGETLNFKSLIEGSNITIGASTNEITISASDTTYAYSSSQSGVNVDLKLNGSDGSVGNVKLVAGNNITLVDSGSNEVTITAAGGGGGLGYTEYVSKISQLGTSDPTETVLSNNTGNSLTWSRIGQGQYRATWATPTSPLYVVLDVGQQFKAYPRFVQVLNHSNNSFDIYVYEMTGMTLQDDELFNTPVKIRIYPSV